MSEACVFSMTESCGSASAVRPLPQHPLRLFLVTDRPASASDLSLRLDPARARVEAAAAQAVIDNLNVDAVLVDTPSDGTDALARALDVLGQLRDGPAAVIVIDRCLSSDERTALYQGGALACVPSETPPEEFCSQIESLLGTKRTAARALQRLRQHTQYLDEQLRLAQRLQRDFLPRQMPTVEGARFAARLEPAAWVAGDFFDIFRLDEHHLGFYVADAVGHGIPAALLTVFVKKALVTKRIEGKHYELIQPAEALQLLNADLISAELRETPFITMIYGIFNERTRECFYARAGHPKPLLLGPDGSVRQLDGDGPLLGIFPDATFDECVTRLEPGHRLVLYSDGAERVEPARQARPKRLFDIIQAGSLLPLEALLDVVLDAVRGATGGGHLADDVTLVALEATAD